MIRIAYLDDERVAIQDYIEDMFGRLKCSHGHPVIAKRGTIKVHHYAHKSNSGCSCGDGKTDWHIKWQDRAIKDAQEVRMIDGNKLHIADTCINTHINGYKGYVIEYQHSDMTEAVMREREQFYNKQGYHLVWVFDTHKWEYKVLTRKGSSISLMKNKGSKFPLYGGYTKGVSKILDFDKKDLLVVTSQSGMTLAGKTISIEEFDTIYLRSYASPDNDIRPFHYSI